MTDTTPVKKAIALLQNTQKEVSELLKLNSALHLPTDHLLTAVIDGLIFVTQRTELTPKTVTGGFDTTPLIQFYEGKSTEQTIISSLPAVVDTPEEEVDKLRRNATELYHHFRQRENAAILEACNALEIRAVAKLAGIDPINHPEQIDHSFINAIKEAITKKEDEQKKKDELFASAEKLEAVKQQTDLSPSKLSKTKASIKKVNEKK